MPPVISAECAAISVSGVRGKGVEPRAKTGTAMFDSAKTLLVAIIPNVDNLRIEPILS